MAAMAAFAKVAVQGFQSKRSKKQVSLARDVSELFTLQVWFQSSKFLKPLKHNKKVFLARVLHIRGQTQWSSK